MLVSDDDPFDVAERISSGDCWRNRFVEDWRVGFRVMVLQLTPSHEPRRIRGMPVLVIASVSGGEAVVGTKASEQHGLDRVVSAVLVDVTPQSGWQPRPGHLCDRLLLPVIRAVRARPRQRRFRIIRGLGDAGCGRDDNKGREHTTNPARDQTTLRKSALCRRRPCTFELACVRQWHRSARASRLEFERS